MVKMHKTMVGGGAFDAPFRWTKTYFMAIIHRFGTSWCRPLCHLWRFADYFSKCDSHFLTSHGFYTQLITNFT